MSAGSVGEQDPNSPFIIEVANQQDRLVIDAETLQRTVQSILADAELESAEISIAVIDDPTMHRLNREYLDHDYPTDVLSFLLEEEDSWIQGEVVVSADTAIKEAERLGWDSHAELLLYVIHGTLHLIGHDDHEPDDRARMRAQERHYLIQSGVDASLIDGRLPDQADLPTTDDQATETPSEPQVDIAPHSSTETGESP